MKRLLVLLALATLATGVRDARAQTIIGDLNNFDTLNDTGQVCYGFEIEIDDVRSTDITYTFDWNHYGAPKIREDNTDPAHPKVFVRYESTKDYERQLGRQQQLHQPWPSRRSPRRRGTAAPTRRSTRGASTSASATTARRRR